MIPTTPPEAHSQDNKGGWGRMISFSCLNCKHRTLRRFEDCEVMWCKLHDKACPYKPCRDWEVRE